MSQEEAERLAHEGGELDEAADIRRRKRGMSAGELEGRERELREALRELRESESTWMRSDDPQAAKRWEVAIERADALLAQPAAGKEREDG